MSAEKAWSDADHQADLEAAIERERLLKDHCRDLAGQLIDAAMELGWGNGEPVGNCLGHIEHVLQERGYEAPKPTPVQRERKKKLPTRAVWDRDNWTCKHCGSHANLTVDHIVPVVKGGTSDMDNLQTLCGSCNSRKGDR